MIVRYVDSELCCAKSTGHSVTDAIIIKIAAVHPTDTD